MARNENDDRNRWENQTGTDRPDERHDDRHRHDRDDEQRWNRLRRGQDASGGEMWHGRDRDIGYSGGMGSWGARDQYGQGSEGWRGDQWGGGQRDDWRGRERGDEWRDQNRGYEPQGRGEDAYNSGRWGRHTANWGEGAGTERFRGAEGGWGGYGSYDRERGGNDWRRNESRGNESRGEWRGGRSEERGRAGNDRPDWRQSGDQHRDWDRQGGGGGNWSYAGYGASYSGGFGGEYGGGYNQREANNQDWARGDWNRGGGEERRREDMGRRWDQGTMRQENRGHWGGQPGGESRGQQGRGHAGRGPKSYQRSDDRIREDVIQRLTDHPDIDASDIDVEVKSGEVILRGVVDDRHAKHLAEDVSDHVWGVREVKNEIRVQRQETGTSSGSAAFHSGSTSNPTLTAPGGEMPRQTGQQQTMGMQTGSNAGENQPRSSETRQNISSGDQGTRNEQISGNKR